MHDALCVLTSTVKETKTCFGGGCSEMLMANAVLEVAATTPGKEAIAMEAFARALIELPTIIAENGGYDSAQLVSELKALHKQSKCTMGLSKYFGQIAAIAEYGTHQSYVLVVHTLRVAENAILKLEFASKTPLINAKRGSILSILCLMLVSLEFLVAAPEPFLCINNFALCP
jgi:T-complex protein 1 subunit beta